MQALSIFSKFLAHRKALLNMSRKNSDQIKLMWHTNLMYIQQKINCFSWFIENLCAYEMSFAAKNTKKMISNRNSLKSSYSINCSSVHGLTDCTMSTHAYICTDADFRISSIILDQLEYISKKIKMEVSIANIQQYHLIYVTIPLINIDSLANLCTESRYFVFISDFIIYSIRPLLSNKVWHALIQLWYYSMILS